MDTSYLSQQVTTIVQQLHGYFDDIGVPSSERDSREAELFTALSETLHNQLKLVASEKHELTEQARQLIRTVRQMEAALDDTKSKSDYDVEDDELKVTHPLLQCIEQLKHKHKTISRLHKERYDQVKELAETVRSWASHLEPAFLSVKLPPSSPNTKPSHTFDISPSYVKALSEEYQKVYDEYNRRVAQVKAMAEEMVMLWGELGTPQVQIDSSIVKHHRENPEQLGLYREDIARIQSKRDKLVEEKHAREKRLTDLRKAVEQLWDKLEIDMAEQKAFLASNRGCGMRVINEYEAELRRLEEIKGQNLHIFIEDARFKLQALWDSLYYSEQEMIEFEPAFIQDVSSDALLSAHETEIARLEALRQQRAPILAKVDKYRTIWQERADLQASSQDASRLLAKGTKGEKRDPTRLLREEKMRKRVEKELPKVEQDLMTTLEAWEEEYGRPFLVHGRRFIDEMADNIEERGTRGGKHAASVRSKTPTNFPPPANTKSARAPPGGRNITGERTKTPTHTRGRDVTGASTVKPSATKFGGSVRNSPSKLPSRQPLGALADGKNSPQRRPKTATGTRSAAEEHNYVAPKLASPSKLATFSRAGAMAPPPPKMKDLYSQPHYMPATPTPSNYSSSTSASDLSSVIMRHASHSTAASSVAPAGMWRAASAESGNWEAYGGEDEEWDFRPAKRDAPEPCAPGLLKKSRTDGLGLRMPMLAPPPPRVQREGTAGSEGWTDDGSVF